MKKPRVFLTDLDGSAYSILARCSRAALDANWPKERVKAVLDDMRSGDYDHLLQVAMREFDVR